MSFASLEHALKRAYWRFLNSAPVTFARDTVTLRRYARAARELPPLSPVGGPADLGERAFAHVGEVVAMGPRHPGSPGWRRQIDYICTTLQGLSLAPARDCWHDAGAGLDFENVSVTIPGSRPGRIVIGAHHDTKNFSGHADPAQNFHFVGANDGGSGVGLLLALAAVLAERDNRATFELVFFDGEESLTVEWRNAAQALYGSRRYVQREMQRIAAAEAGPIEAMILLDMVGCADLRIDDDRCSDPALKLVMRRAAMALGYTPHFFGQCIDAADDHQPFLAAGVPSVDLIQKRHFATWHTAEDTIEHMSAQSLQKVGQVVLTALPEIEARWIP